MLLIVVLLFGVWVCIVRMGLLVRVLLVIIEVFMVDSFCFCFNVVVIFMWLYMGVENCFVNFL